MLQLPGHTTHWLQPVVIAIFKLCETFHDQAIQQWMRTNPGHRETQHELACLLNDAYGQTVTLSNSENGYRATGLWPVNHTVFLDHDFFASDNLNSILDSSVGPNYITEEPKTHGRK